MPCSSQPSTLSSSLFMEQRLQAFPMAVGHRGESLSCLFAATLPARSRSRAQARAAPAGLGCLSQRLANSIFVVLPCPGGLFSIQGHPCCFSHCRHHCRKLVARLRAKPCMIEQGAGSLFWIVVAAAVPLSLRRSRLSSNARSPFPCIGADPSLLQRR